MIDLNAYLMQGRDVNDFELVNGKISPSLSKRIVCADGLSLSVQASTYSYCSPRENIGPWNQVEVGFPSSKVDEIMSYAEDPNDPTETVYGWVPIRLVEEIIESHGGIVEKPEPTT